MMKRHAHSRRFVSFLAALALSGCGHFSHAVPAFTCPQTGFIDKADRATLLAPEGGVIATASMAGFKGECSPVKKAVAAELNLSIPFDLHKGPAAGEAKSESFPYFIAVLGPHEEILQRQAFRTTIEFDEAGNGRQTEEHVVKIPLDARTDADKYKVVMGFILTPDQLKYNKEH